MKKFVSFLLSFAFAGSLFAQMSGYSSGSYSDGTTLGANETISANGIALGNAVKLRGFADFIYHYEDDGDNDDDADFKSAADLDILLTLPSDVTGEIHLSGDSDGLDLEQVFARYSFGNDFHFTFGRQLSALGFEQDEAPLLYTVTNAYDHTSGFHGRSGNYIDGLRLNYNNGMFGFIFGLYDGYFKPENVLMPEDLDDHIAIDIAASVMFFPGLEGRIGFAHESFDEPGGDDINQFNTWLAWNPSALTLAAELDIFDVKGNDIWSLMLLANYQFTDWFAGTLRYTHEDDDDLNAEVDRITLALLFTLTENLGLNVEYSHSDRESSDVDEFLVEGLLSF